MIVWIVGALVVLSYAARASKDKLSFHYSTSVFKRFNPLFFNPKLSWMNKWKDNDPKKGPKFPLSTSALVFLTDGWHFFSFIELNSGMMALAIASGTITGYNVIWCFLTLRVIYAIAFNGLFDYVLKKNK